MDLIECILEIKDKFGKLMLFEIDKKFNNTHKYSPSLNKPVPSYLFDIIEKIEHDRFSDIQSLLKSVVFACIKYDDPETANPLFKFSSIVKRTMKAKIESIKAETLLSSEKRTNKSVSFYQEDEEYSNNDDEPSYDNDIKIYNDTMKDNMFSHFYQKISAKVDDEGIPIIKYFYRLPTRRKYQEYYDILKNPISFSIIRRKVIQNKYHTLSEFKDDLSLLLNNIKMYFPTQSENYRMGQILSDHIDDILKAYSENTLAETTSKSRDVTFSEPKVKVEKSKAGCARVYKVYKKLLKIKSRQGTHHVSSGFIHLPPKEQYPDYYNIIAEPIDLDEIKSKILSQRYKTAKMFYLDLALMIANAKFYNKPSSEIYKDAVQIENHLSTVAGQKFKNYVDKKIKNMKQVPMVDQTQLPLLELIMHALKATDSDDHKLAKLANVQKELREIKRHLHDYDSLDYLFVFLVSTLKKLVKKSLRKPTQLSLLLLISAIQAKYLHLSTSAVLVFHSTPQNIVLHIYSELLKIKDAFGVTCMDTLRSFSYITTIKFPQAIFNRTININTISQSVQNGEYNRIMLFLLDFVTLCREARKNFPSNSEPFTHSVLLQEELFKILDVVISTTLYKISNTSIFNDELSLAQLEYETKVDISEISDALSLKSIESEDFDSATNFVDEKFSLDSVHNTNCVRFHSELFYPGDYVLVSDKDTNFIVYIRKMFILPSDKKACIGNRLRFPHEIELFYTRKFAPNELIFTNEFAIFKIKKIIRKVYVFHLNNLFSCGKDHTADSVFFYHTFYRLNENHLSSIDDDQVISKSKRDFQFSSDSNLLCRSVEIPHSVKFEHDNDSLQSYGMLHLITHICDVFSKDFTRMVALVGHSIVRVHDFIILKHSENPFVYQITELINEKTCMFKCRKYICAQQYAFLPPELFYQQEVIQTDDYEDVGIEHFSHVVSVLTYSDYYKYRVTDIPEESVYVCLHKLVSNRLITADDFYPASLYFENELMFFTGDRTFKRIFGNSLKYNIDELTKSLEVNLVDSDGETTPGKMCSTKVETSLLQQGNSYRCCWGDCNHNLNNFINLHEHFEEVHAKDARRDYCSNEFYCMWRNCSRTRESGLFPTYGRLYRHVRDVHLRTAHLNKVSSRPSIAPAFEDKSVQESSCCLRQNPLNSPVLMLRDTYVESLIRIIQKKQSDLSRLQNLVNLLSTQIAKDGSSECKSILENINQNSCILSDSLNTVLQLDPEHSELKQNTPVSTAVHQSTDEDVERGIEKMTAPIMVMNTFNPTVPSFEIDDDTFLYNN